MKKKLGIDRKLEIETKLEEIKSKSVLELVNEGYLSEEISFICRAILMPLKEISEYIEIYDSSKPNIDELTFIQRLCSRYHTDHQTLICRIKEVRSINKLKAMEHIKNK